MAATQLSFSLRTASNCKTVHLLGSWDMYKNMLPLSKDTSVKGGWKGTFRFQGSMLKPNERYWYYFLVDNCSVAWDQKTASIKEPTTGRMLNVLDVPSKPDTAAKRSQPQPTSRNALYYQPTAAPASAKHESKQSQRNSAHIPRGRALSPSLIQSPRPQKPFETKYVATADFTKHDVVKSLTRQFSNTRLGASSSRGSSSSSSDMSDSGSEIDCSDSSSDIDSDVASDVPSLSSSRSGGSSSSSSSLSSSPSSGCHSARLSPATSSCSGSSGSEYKCTCSRFGLTKHGARVKLDCGGVRCHGSYSSDSGSDFEENVPIKKPSKRRQGIIVQTRAPRSRR